MKLYRARSFSKSLMALLLFSALFACSDSAEQQAAAPQEAQPVNEQGDGTAAPAVNDDPSVSSTQSVEQPVMPSDGPAPEDSPVPAVADPNVPALPDQTLGQVDQTAEDAQSASLGREPISNQVPGSPTVVTPDVDVSDDASTETTASAAIEQ